jgi:hypothetical protein
MAYGLRQRLVTAGSGVVTTPPRCMGGRVNSGRRREICTFAIDDAIEAAASSSSSSALPALPPPLLSSTSCAAGMFCLSPLQPPFPFPSFTSFLLVTIGEGARPQEGASEVCAAYFANFTASEFVWVSVSEVCFAPTTWRTKLPLRESNSAHLRKSKKGREGQPRWHCARRTHRVWCCSPSVPSHNQRRLVHTVRRPFGVEQGRGFCLLQKLFFHRESHVSKKLLDTPSQLF